MSRIGRGGFAAGIAAVGLAGIAALGPASAQQPPPAEIAAMKEAYVRPAPRPVGNPALVELGRLLFHDPRLSASGQTACVSCHAAHLGWAATDARSRNDSGKLTARKSQPVMGLGHAGGVPAGWDGRSATLEALVKASIATGAMSMRETDAPVEVRAIEARIRAIPDYAAKFAAALPGTPVGIDAIATAIAAYERTIEPGPASFDRRVGGGEGAISESAKRGFVLFNTKGTCVACHGGWRFTDDGFHDIGTATADLGRGRVDKTDPAMQYASKTPTLRSAALRPPYMHDGSAMTLYEVVKHYETGGIDRPSRSAAMTPLALSKRERLDLVAFMQTLTGVPEGEPPPALPGPK